MPFEQRIPKPFNEMTVQRAVPAASGVYGISNASEWIYIGETDDLQGALLNHLQERGGALLQRLPTGFVVELCNHAGRLARQSRLVVEYRPACNPTA